MKKSDSLFRIDDISLNTSEQRVVKLLRHFMDIAPHSTVILAVSPGMIKLEQADHEERVFPSILNTYSDYTRFYDLDTCGVPKWVFNLKEIIPSLEIIIASHGLVHVDHRLLNIEAQRLSIRTSCSLVKSNVFVPPFHKYNQDTIQVCDQLNISLIKREDGWEHLKFVRIAQGGKYYIHMHDLPDDDFQRWINNGVSAQET